MFNFMRLLAATILLLLCFVVPATADWATYKSAQVRSKDKNILRIDRSSNGPVRAQFTLRPKVTGAFESKLPIYQVDNNKIHDLQSAKNMKTDKKKNYWILWQIYDGKGDINDDLLELMNGKEVVFQYYLPGGMIKESIFSLKGAKEAIGEVLR